jgi:PAS domain S-box-containing protein
MARSSEKNKQLQGELQRALDRIEELESKLAVAPSHERDPALLGLIDGMDQIAVVKDRRLRCRAVNSAYLDLVGLDSRDEAAGKTDQDLLESLASPAQIQKCMDNDLKALALPRGEHLAVEERFGPAGQERALLAKKFPIHDEDGALAGLGVLASEISQREQDKQKLDASEKRFAEIIESMPEPVLALDEEGRVMAWSRSMEELTGIRTDQVLGLDKEGRRGILDGEDLFFLADWVVRPDPELKALYAEVKQDGRLFSIKRELGHLGEKPYLAWGLVAPLGSPDGEIRGAVESVRNLYPIKSLERELREGEERFRQVVESIREMIWFEDFTTGEMLYVSPACEELLGCSRESLLGKRFALRDFIYPDDLEIVHSAVERLQETDGFVEHEHRMVRVDGRVIWVWLRVYQVLDNAGAIQRLVGVAEDITQRKLAAEALKNSLARFSTLVHTSPDAIFQVDLQGTITYASPRALEMLGLEDAQETLGRSVLDWMDSKDKERAKTVIAHALSREALDQTTRDYLVRRKDKTSFVGSFSSAPLRGQNGQLEGFISVMRDVTEKKLMEERLLAAKEAAEAASQAKSEFLANMSHEIRTPLNAILGMLQLLAMSGLTKDQERDVETAFNAGQSLLRIISDILDLSKVEAGKLDLHCEAANLADVVLPVVSGVRDEAERKGLELKLNIEPGTPAEFIGDAARLRQVLFNLVGNSVKYTDEGEVELYVRTLPQFENERGTVWHFAVTDTGVGIPDDKLEIIFESFTQADGSYTRNYGGSGLGLAIVKRLVRLLGGAFNITSLERGTEVHFTLRMPTSERPKACKPKVKEPPAPAAVVRRALLAEDEPVNLLAARRLLEKLNLEVVSASNGKQALDLLERQAFDVLFMDIQMPVMDGLTAIRTFKAQPHRFKNPEAPIIAMTAHAMEGDIEMLREAGVRDFAFKPIMFSRLKEIVTALDLFA